MDNYNGWLPPWRVVILKRCMVNWVNYMVGSRYFATSLTTLERDLASSDLVLHLVSVVSGKSVFDEVLRDEGTGTVGEGSVRIAVEFLRRNGLTQAVDLTWKDEIKTVMFLFWLASMFYSRVLLKCDVDNFKSSLLRDVQRRLEGSALGRAPLNFGSDYSDGQVLLTLLSREDATFDTHKSRALSGVDLLASVLDASGKLGIPSLVQAKDVATQPEEFSVSVFVAMLLHSLDAAKIARVKRGARDAAELGEALAAVTEELNSLKMSTHTEHDKATQLEQENRRLHIEAYDLEHKGLSSMAVLEIEDLRANLEDAKRTLHEATENFKETIAAKNDALDDMQKELREARQEGKYSLDKLKQSLVDGQAMRNKLHALTLKLELKVNKQPANKRLPAPRGELTLMFTDVQGSTAQWEEDADAMGEALKIHNEAIRDCLFQHRGYEVKTEGDSFMCAFERAKDAVECAFSIQLTLLKTNWSPETLAMKDAAEEVDDKGKLLFRGLRVRIGVHTGEPRCEEDPTTKRTDYFGPIVNRAARIESAGKGGQILCSAETYNKVKGEAGLAMIMEDLGNFELKGLKGSVRLYSILPPELDGRKFSPPRTNYVPPKADSFEKEIDLLNKESGSIMDNIGAICVQADSHDARMRELQAKLNKASVALSSSTVPASEKTVARAREECSVALHETGKVMDEQREVRKVVEDYRRRNETITLELELLRQRFLAMRDLLHETRTSSAAGVQVEDLLKKHREDDERDSLRQTILKQQELIDVLQTKVYKLKRSSGRVSPESKDSELSSMLSALQDTTSSTRMRRGSHAKSTGSTVPMRRNQSERTSRGLDVDLVLPQAPVDTERDRRRRGTLGRSLDSRSGRTSPILSPSGLAPRRVPSHDPTSGSPGFPRRSSSQEPVSARSLKARSKSQTGQLPPIDRSRKAVRSPSPDER